MSVRIIKYFLFLFFTLSYTQIFCEETPEIEKADTYENNCREYAESLSKYVGKARKKAKMKKYDSAISEYKRHLKCWDDKKIYVELGDLYVKQSKGYLALIAYKKGNDLKKRKLIQNTNLEDIQNNKVFFNSIAYKKQELYLKKYNTLKTSSIIFLTLGSVATATGLALFIHEKAGGENSGWAQFSLMLGGLAFVNAGLFTYALKDYRLNISNAYGEAPELFNGKYFTSPDEYFEHSGLRSKVHLQTSKTYLKFGITMIFTSIPMFIVSGFAHSLFSEAREEGCRGRDGFECMLSYGSIYFMEGMTYIPGLVSLAGGIFLLVKAGKWSKVKGKETLFTLERLTPMINPITKTYGISTGFSF